VKGSDLKCWKLSGASGVHIAVQRAAVEKVHSAGEGAASYSDDDSST
jgi:hypothetical protein